jgi:large subunit ribosomal protein L4
MKINLYSLKSDKTTTATLPKVFEAEVNKKLLAQALHVYRDRTHAGTSKVQTRGEVSLTTAKWFKQKGTGRARHGAKSAPIFVGGGVAHGPKGVKRVLSLPTKMRRIALASALSLKAKDNKISLLEGLDKLGKTNDAGKLVELVRSGQKAPKNARITFVVSDANAGAYQYLKNLDRVQTEKYSNINAYSVYIGGQLVFDNEIFAQPSPKAAAVKKTKKEIKK